MPETLDKKEAQLRVERIHAFQRQLEELICEGVLTLTAEQRGRLDDHLARSLSELAERFDVDVSESQKQISLGMRILSALGGLAFCAALILFFYRFWGVMTIPLQIAVLAGAPIVGLAAMELVARREHALYFTALLGLIVLSAFALNLFILGSLLNVTPSPGAFLAWGLFALALAYAYRLRTPLVGGLIALVIFTACSMAALTGGYSLFFFMRPETLLPAGLLVAAVPFVAPHRRLPEFPVVYRMVGLFGILLALAILAHGGEISFLPFGAGIVETVYRILGFTASGLIIWLGIRNGHPPIVNMGSLFFTIYLFDRLISSWWNWMPKYLFFLIIGVTALALLLVFRRLRAGIKGVSA